MRAGQRVCGQVSGYASHSLHPIVYVLVAQAEGLGSFDKPHSPQLTLLKNRSKNQRLDRLALRLAGKSVRHVVGVAETPARYLPPLPRPTLSNMPEMPVLARLRGLQPGNGGRYRAEVSATPTIFHMPYALSSDPKRKVI